MENTDYSKSGFKLVCRRLTVHTKNTNTCTSHLNKLDVETLEMPVFNSLRGGEMLPFSCKEILHTTCFCMHETLAASPLKGTPPDTIADLRFQNEICFCA